MAKFTFGSEHSMATENEEIGLPWCKVVQAKKYIVDIQKVISAAEMLSRTLFLQIHKNTLEIANKSAFVEHKLKAVPDPDLLVVCYWYKELL